MIVNTVVAVVVVCLHSHRLIILRRVWFILGSDASNRRFVEK